MIESGAKIYLKQVMQTNEIIVGGDTISEEVLIGSVVHARPGPAVDGPEYIRMHISGEGSFRWNAPLGDYDPDTVDDDPLLEARWVAE